MNTDNKDKLSEVHLLASVSINLLAPFKRATLTVQEGEHILDCVDTLPNPFGQDKVLL